MKKSLVAVLAFFIGAFAMYGVSQARLPGKEKVREALYVACVNGTGYQPLPNALSYVKHPGCSRRNIDLLLANTYGETFIEPMDSAISSYEKMLEKYKK